MTMLNGSSENQPVRTPSLPDPPDLKDLSQAALFLDFDGTLVEIAPAPDAIRVDPGLPAVLRDHPPLANIGRHSLRESLRCARLAPWDDHQRRMISFREARRISRDRSIAAMSH